MTRDTEKNPPGLSFEPIALGPYRRQAFMRREHPDALQISPTSTRYSRLRMERALVPGRKVGTDASTWNPGPPPSAVKLFQGLFSQASRRHGGGAVRDPALSHTSFFGLAAPIDRDHHAGGSNLGKSTPTGVNGLSGPGPAPLGSCSIYERHGRSTPGLLTPAHRGARCGNKGNAFCPRSDIGCPGHVSKPILVFKKKKKKNTAFIRKWPSSKSQAL